jgi:hypothetical protein
VELYFLQVEMHFSNGGKFTIIGGNVFFCGGKIVISGVYAFFYRKI